MKNIRNTALHGLIAFFLVTTALWIHRDRIPPLWDSAQYLRETLQMHGALTHGGPLSFLNTFSQSMGNKAPLIAALPLPLYLVFGESHQVARSVNLVCLVLASWALFRIGEMTIGRHAALLSVIVLNTFPIAAGMSRQFLADYALMTLVILWIYLLLRWERGATYGAAAALGVVAGLGMLAKVTFPLYVAAVTALVLARDVRRHRGIRREVWMSAALAATIAIPLAALWYFRNWRTILGYVKSAGYGQVAVHYGSAEVFSLRTVLQYWRDLADTGIGGYYVALILLAAGLHVILFVRRRHQTETELRDYGMLIAWAVPPFLVLTFTVSKDVRFALPYLPAVALLLSAAWMTAASRRRGAVLAVIGACGILVYLGYSFAFSRGPWAHPPQPEEWPAERIARIVGTDAARRGIDRASASTLFDHPQLSPHNLNYYALRNGSRTWFRACHFMHPDSARQCVDRIRREADYVLVKTGTPGEPYHNVRNIEALRLMAHDFSSLPRIALVPLPDGSEVSIFRGAGTR